MWWGLLRAMSQSYRRTKWRGVTWPTKCQRRWWENWGLQLTNRLDNDMTDWLADWLTDWLFEWLIDWLISWLTDWLIDLLIDWLTDWLLAFLIDLIVYLIDYCVGVVVSLLSFPLSNFSYLFVISYNIWQLCWPSVRKHLQNVSLIRL